VVEMVDHLYPYICEIHAKDGKNGKMGNTLVGQGEASFHATMEQVNKYHYAGWVFLETNYENLSTIKEDIVTLERYI
jgi:sugar phosphate isomerase/epimerase